VQPQQVSSELGLSLSMIYKWAEPADTTAGSGSTNPLDRIDALLNALRTAGSSNGFASAQAVLHFESEDQQASSLLSHSRDERDCAGFADLLAVIATAAADNQIIQKEATKSAHVGRN